MQRLINFLDRGLCLLFEILYKSKPSTDWQLNTTRDKGQRNFLPKAHQRQLRLLRGVYELRVQVFAP